MCIELGRREDLKDLCRLAETWKDSNYKQGDKHGSGKSYPPEEALQQPELQLTKTVCHLQTHQDK